MSKTNGYSVAGIESGSNGSMTKDPGLQRGMDVLDSRGEDGGIDTFMERALEAIERTGSAICAFTPVGSATDGN